MKIRTSGNVEESNPGRLSQCQCLSVLSMQSMRHTTKSHFREGVGGPSNLGGGQNHAQISPHHGKTQVCWGE